MTNILTILLIMILLVACYFLHTYVIKKYFVCDYDIANVDNNSILTNRQLIDYEHKMSEWYMLGNDRFRISHGKKYLDFFKRLGIVTTTLMTDNNKIIGSLISTKMKVNGEYYYYIGDVKIDKEYRGHGLTNHLIRKNIGFKYFTSKWFGISMNPNGTIVNKSNDQYYPKIMHAKIFIYLVDYQTMKKVINILGAKLGQYSFISLESRKDLILESTGKPMNLLHMQKGPQARHSNAITKPNKGYMHMFSFMENSNEKQILDSYNITTLITGTILHNGIDNLDFILTSDL